MNRAFGLNHKKHSRVRGAALMTIVCLSVAYAGPSLATHGAVGTGGAIEHQRQQVLMARVEERAGRHSFADLDQFAQRAADSSPSMVTLRRLNHAVIIYINQSELDRAERWNNAIRRQATALGNRRYLRVADLNADLIAYSRGDHTRVQAFRKAVDDKSDWYVQVLAVRHYASSLLDEKRIGEALRLLSLTQTQIPDGEDESASAHSAMWELIGIGLMELSDVEGATDAFARYELDYTHADWPRPDFDSIYNLADMAVTVGDTNAAERYYAVHDRLTQRTDLRGLGAYNALLCARVSHLKDDMQGVLSCLQGFDDLNGVDQFVAIRALPLLAIANARLGHVELAQKALVASRSQPLQRGGIGLAGLTTQAEAEVLAAQGRYPEAVDMLRRASQEQAIVSARHFSSGVHQITNDMQRQLSQRREQLATEQANTRLQRAVIRAQRWIVGVCLFFLLGGALVLLRYWRQAVQLRQARQKAEAASSAKTAFLANMSHEIRTPLNGVVAMADELHRRDLAPEDRELVDIVRGSAATLATLLNDILDSARIESGELLLAPVPINLANKMRHSFLLWKLQADAKGVELRLEGADVVDRTVMADPVRLRQVINNLLSNAIKFTERGTVTLKVEEVGPDRVRVTVRDTGVGFDEEQRQRLFKRFQQADDSITRRFGGSGLGLNISYELVTLMGGTMDCVSRPGEGATFWFEVPLPVVDANTVGQAAMEPDAPHVADAPSGPLPALATGQGRLKVLLADDHAANRKVVEILLQGMEVDLTSVTNGKEAVQAYQSGDFDLVLMDMQMPEMDGLSATRAIRQCEAVQCRARVPLIMLTANAMAEHVAAGREAGADGHLAKPLTAAALIGAINAALA